MKNFTKTFKTLLLAIFLLPQAFFLFGINIANAEQICAYVAPDNKYACLNESNANAITKPNNTCYRRSECSGKSCIVIDSSFCGKVKNTPSHTECVNKTCSIVAGEGGNLCTQDSDCDTRYASLCAYVAPDNKYACLAGTEFEASLSSGRTTCSNINKIECKNNSCASVLKNLCGQPVPKNSSSNPSSPSTNPGSVPGSTSAVDQGTKSSQTNGIDCSVPGNCLYNPIPGADGLIQLFLIVVKGFLTIMGVVAVCFVIVGGFSMVVSGGNEEAVAKAKKMVTWAILGMVVSLLAFSMVAIVQSLLEVDVKDFPQGTGYRQEESMKYEV